MPLKHQKVVLSILLISLILISCSSLSSLLDDTSRNEKLTNNSNNEGNTEDPADHQDFTSDEDIIAIINMINANDISTFSYPEEIIAIGHSVIPEILPLLESEDLIQRWAAVYVITRIARPEDIESIAVGLNDPVYSNRVGIAATLLWLGDDRGLPLLEEALSSNEQLIFSHPPKSVADYVRFVLEELNPESLSDFDSKQSLKNAAPFLIPLKDVSVNRNECKVEIEVNLQFSGTGATEPLAAKWKAGIIDMWDEKLSSYCCETDLTVNTKVGGPTDPGYAQINVIQVPPNGFTSFNSYGGTVSNGTSNDVFGSWASNEPASVAAHEVGHAMGVDDEYAPDSDGFAVPTGEAIGEKLAGIPGIMAQTWKDNAEQAPEAKPRHIDEILKFYGIQCVCCGLVEWEIGTNALSFTGKITTCDGVNWHGEFDETLQTGPTSVQAFTEFDFVMDLDTNIGETEFVAEGTWTIDGEVVPFQDSITFKISLVEDGTKALINSMSTGGVLLVEGQSVPVPQAIPVTTGDLNLPVESNQSCTAE